MEEKKENVVGKESTDKPSISKKVLDWFKSVKEGSKMENKSKDQTLVSKIDTSEVTENGQVLKDFTLSSVEVRLQNLTKVFVDKKGNETRAVDDFTVVIPGGKLIGLLGPSGCGKSTTLYMIAGLHKPTAGQIFFGEEDVTFMPPEKRGIGLVFQNYALYPHMTVRQNIMFPLENLNVPKQEAAKRAKEMAELVHIGELLDRKPSQLSGGQQQRVAIARALVKKPRVLLLDEPLSNLDARLRLQTREEIRRIQKETGITTIFVTHDQEEAMSISDEIVVMNFGVRQQMNEPQNVYDEPQNMFVAKFLGNPPINISEGYVEKKKLKLIDGMELEEIDVPDQKVYVGIRPEFFEIDQGGSINAVIEIVEHIGRDTMAYCKIKGYDEEVRAIVTEGRHLQPGQEIKLGYRKIFVFNKETGERIK